MATVILLKWISDHTASPCLKYSDVPPLFTDKAQIPEHSINGLPRFCHCLSLMTPDILLTMYRSHMEMWFPGSSNLFQASLPLHRPPLCPPNPLYSSTSLSYSYLLDKLACPQDPMERTPSCIILSSHQPKQNWSLLLYIFLDTSLMSMWPVDWLSGMLARVFPSF